MDNETRRIYLILIIATIIFAIIGFYLGWLDNGPKIYTYAIKQDDRIVL